MSYEGHIQALCENGHYNSYDESYEDESPACSVCGAPIVWTNSVDDTNNDAFGEVLMKQLEIHPEEYTITKEVVDGRSVVITRRIPAVYRIPNKDETDELRTFLSEDNKRRYINSGKCTFDEVADD